jgi:hypothetical protein
MKAPFKLTIEIRDAAGELIVEHHNHKIKADGLLPVERALAAALIGMGQAAEEARAAPAKPTRRR